MNTLNKVTTDTIVQAETIESLSAQVLALQEQNKLLDKALTIVCEFEDYVRECEETMSTLSDYKNMNSEDRIERYKKSYMEDAESDCDLQEENDFKK